MAQKSELEHILHELLPEFKRKFRQWNSEYTQERDLGVRGEFVGLYRKTRKLKTILWDGGDATDWREDVRTILLEVAAHAFLAVHDIDMGAEQPHSDNVPEFHAPDETKWQPVERIEDEGVPF